MAMPLPRRLMDRLPQTKKLKSDADKEHGREIKQGVVFGMLFKRFRLGAVIGIERKAQWPLGSDKHRRPGHSEIPHIAQTELVP